MRRLGHRKTPAPHEFADQHKIFNSATMNDADVLQHADTIPTITVASGAEFLRRRAAENSAWTRSETLHNDVGNHIVEYSARIP